MHYGTTIPNLTIHGKPAPYPVVNERSIRAAAGVMFAIGLSAFWYAWATGNYTPVYIVVSIFWLDFFLKSVLQPHWSIFGKIGDWLTIKQKPEYVGAIQKRFAWGIGLIMATTMIIVTMGLQMRGWLPLAICMTCLFFMWLESAAGICVGCKIYGYLRKKSIIKAPEHTPACPGGSCTL